jgi:hypothetical protein
MAENWYVTKGPRVYTKLTHNREVMFMTFSVRPRMSYLKHYSTNFNKIWVVYVDLYTILISLWCLSNYRSASQGEALSILVDDRNKKRRL